MKPKLCISKALVHLLIAVAAALLTAARCESIAVEDASLPRISANTNLRAAGVLSEGSLSLELEIREGALYPEDEPGPSVEVFAFGERGKQLQIPGPMIRVPQDTRIHVTVHNLIARDVQIHGMHSRPGKNDDIFEVTSGATREITFSAGAPGAYYYWATAGGDTLGGRPYKEDSQLHGAFIVDPPGAVPDRVFVIGTWRDRRFAQESFDIPVINGKSWPYTERLQYPVGSEVRWVWLNPSGNVHPMHLHGSYFQVLSMGDAEQTKQVPPSQIREVSTNFMAVGGTMTTLWKPERTGRWIFHCHILTHTSPETSAFHHDTMVGEQHTDPLNHMSGLVMGITITARNSTLVAHKPPKPKRKLNLLIAKDKSDPKRYTYSISEVGHARQTGGGPGPTMVLTRNQPVAIHITNELDEATSVHWHGIELQSYYDGVAGWGGDGPKVTPMIASGKSFDAVLAPPRAGTFMYHTHMNDLSQLSSGLYGALIVVPERTKFQTESDKVLLLSRNGRRKDGELLLNGSTTPPPLQLRAGVRYRLRFIDILANNSIVINAAQDGKPVEWIPIAKDGADLASVQSVATPASFTIAPGETYDFTLTPEKSGEIEFKYDLILLDEHVKQVAMVIGEGR